MIDLFLLFKLSAIVLILWYFKILHKLNSLLYIAGVLALALISPNRSNRLPETVLSFSTLLFSGYLVLYGIVSYLRNFSITVVDISRKRIQYHYINPFLSMFSVSLIFALAAIQGWTNFVISFLILFIFKMETGHALKKYPLLRRINCIVLFAAVISTALMFEKYAPILQALKVSAVYSLMLSIYYFVKGSYARPYVINQLRPGMLPAETIVKRNGKYLKQDAFFLIYSFLQSSAINRYLKTEEVISPFKSLTRESINELKKAKRINGIDNVLIQKTVDFRIFLVLGLVVTYFYIGVY